MFACETRNSGNNEMECFYFRDDKNPDAEMFYFDAVFDLLLLSLLNHQYKASDGWHARLTEGGRPKRMS